LRKTPLAKDTAFSGVEIQLLDSLTATSAKAVGKGAKPAVQRVGKGAKPMV
jgi:hypothetical protein